MEAPEKYYFFAGRLLNPHDYIVAIDPAGPDDVS
jgi:hypothetical protein